MHQDAPILISEEKPRAAFQHRCAICGHNIVAGERHTRFVYRDPTLRDRQHSLRTARLHFYCPGELKS